MSNGRPRKLLYGIGRPTYGTYAITSAGKRTPEYELFCSMFKRVYDAKALALRPTYTGCTVDQAFHDYQDFARWCNEQPGFDMGWHLDKDLISQGNKVYGPEFCAFVPAALNSLFLSGMKKCDDLPTGVYWNKDRAFYTSSISIDGTSRHLGCFQLKWEAEAAYLEAKRREALRQLETYRTLLDYRVTNAIEARCAS